MPAEQWLLTTEERGNPDTDLDRRHPDGLAWTEGNSCRPLVDGVAYFARLKEVLDSTGHGDLVLFTDWRSDPDQHLDAHGSSLEDVLGQAITRGVLVRGLVWRSHASLAGMSEQENRDLATTLNEAGGEILLDQRVRRMGSHHQKVVVVRHRDRPAEDVAFAGGIDLAHGRHDDARHHGDPQVLEMADEYGPQPSWHDVQLELHGPAVGDIEASFRERWEDPAELDNPGTGRQLVNRLHPHLEHESDPLPEQHPDPSPAGSCAVQVLRTYPTRRPAYPFASDGERSIARGYSKALRRARRLVYLEDQYLWSAGVAQVFAEALREHPDLHLIVVVPKVPQQDGFVQVAAEVTGRKQALDLVEAAGPGRVAVYDLESPDSDAVYVHAKVCIIDDVWATVGSDNINMRSWTYDSELTCAVLDSELDPREPTDPAGLGDSARVFARDLRLRLMREHLDRQDSNDAGLLDPGEAWHALRASAANLDAWHDGDPELGPGTPRPPGRLRTHLTPRLSPAVRALARPALRYAIDPDGRPARLRRSHSF